MPRIKSIETGGPMLASNEVITDFEAVTYPVIASAKIDAWRCYHNDGPRTRKGFILPNIHTRTMLMSESLAGLDGELVAGSETDPNAMQKAQSAFSRIEGEPDFTWWIFDDWRREQHAFKDYFFEHIKPRERNLPSFVKIIPQQVVQTPQELDSFSTNCKVEGFEGAIIRSPDSPYKYGRSTTKQGWMLKVKPYTYEEAYIVCLNEGTTNVNELERDNFGRAKRSSAKAGKIPSGTLGSFTLRNEKGEFNASTGHLDDWDKASLWAKRDEYVGRRVTFKYLAHGMKKAPRHAQFVAFRAEVDG